jgi:hypothetical protein
MTTQVWTPQRFSPDTLTFVPPSQIDISQQIVNANVTLGGSANTLIDLRQFVRGGRLPYRYAINSGLIAPCRYSKDRGIITIPSTIGGNMNLDTTIRDAYGSAVNRQIGIIVATGPLSVAAVYPAVHNGVAYDYTPLITGGNPPYTCILVGIGFQPLNLFFDATTGRLQSPNPTVFSTSLGNLWQLTVKDTPWSITGPNGAVSQGGGTTVIANGTIDFDNP